MTAEALQAAFTDGATVTSIARTAGVDRSTVRPALRRPGIENPHADRYRRPAELDDAEWVRARYIDARMPIHAIADELGVADNTVARALRRHGVPRRRQADRPGGIDPEWLRMRYVDDRRTIVEIAREVGVSKSTVFRAIVGTGSSVTVAQHARDRHRSRELLEVLGGRLVRHAVDHDARVPPTLESFASYPQPTTVRGLASVQTSGNQQAGRGPLSAFD